MVPGADPTVYEEVPDLDKLTVRKKIHERMYLERLSFSCHVVFLVNVKYHRPWVYCSEENRVVFVFVEGAVCPPPYPDENQVVQLAIKKCIRRTLGEEYVVQQLAAVRTPNDTFIETHFNTVPT